MDKYDIQILAQLQKNGRISVADLAQEVALTTTPCARRLKILEDNKVITGYGIHLNQKLLGLPATVIVDLSLGGRSEQVIKAFEEKIKLIPQVMECYMTSGNCDYQLKVVMENLESYYVFLREKILTIPEVEDVSSSFVLSKVVDRSALPLSQIILQGKR